MNIQRLIINYCIWARQHPWRSLLALIALSGLAYYAMRQYQITHPHYEHAMTSLTQNMQPHCFGRFLIDLPSGARVDSASLTINDISIAYDEFVSHEEFEARMAKRWQELQALTKDDYNRPYAEPSKRLTPIPNGEIFLYEYEYLDGLDVHGVDRGPRLIHQAEGYLWRDEVLYEFKSRLKGEEKIAALMPRIETRADSRPPTQPGFCFGRGLLETSGAFEVADAHVSFTFPGQEDFGLIAGERIFDGEAEKPLLQRRTEKLPFNQAMFAEALKRKPGLVYGEHKYRFSKRPIAKFEGEEIVVGSTEKKFTYSTSVGSEWEYVGKSGSNELPALSLNMGVSFTTQQAPSPLGAFPSKAIAPKAISEEEYFALWDAILKSLRPRPVASTPAAEKPRSSLDAEKPHALPLGTRVSSLRSCPQTGTYECFSASTSSRRAFIQQGRPMPGMVADVPKKIIAGFFRGKEQQEIEVSWTLISYERDA